VQEEQQQNKHCFSKHESNYLQKLRTTMHHASPCIWKIPIPKSGDISCCRNTTFQCLCVV